MPRLGLENDISSAQLILLTGSTENTRTINDLYMNGPDIFSFRLKAVPDIFSKLLETAHVSMNDIVSFVFHQANRFMLEHIQKIRSIQGDRFCIAFYDVGNTVSSTIPIALKRAIAAKRLTPRSLAFELRGR